MANDSSQIRVSKDVLKDVESLSANEKALFVSFVQRLEENPYDPSLISSSCAEGDFLASLCQRTYT